MAASLPGDFNIQELTDAGAPAANYRLYTYAAGTTTHKTAYTDAAGLIPHTYTGDGLGGVYIALNARGELPAPLFLASGGYDIALKTPTGATVWTRRAYSLDEGGSSLVTALRTDLATTTDSTGAGMVGLALTLAYGSGTVGGFLRGLNHISKYGTLANNGTTDDAAVFQAAAASGDRFIDARGVNCKIGSTISGSSGQVWLLAGSTFTTTSSSLTVWDFDGKSDWAMVGPFSIIGAGTTIGTSVGIHVQDCSRWRIDSPTIRSMQGYGIKLDPGTSTTSRSDHGVVTNPRLDQCYYGWADSAGTGAEYCTVINAHVTRCTAYGVITTAGNINWLGGQIVDNVAVGMKVGAGSNHAHGVVSAMNLNHNGTFNLHCEQVTNGQTFNGCHFYANDSAGSGTIFLDRSKGINISGGHLDCQVFNYKDGSSGLNVIENMYCPGSYGVARRAGTNNGHDELVIRGCYGPGALTVAGGGVDTTGVTINDPATCFANATRDAASTQSLTSGVEATLIWPTKLLDRRNALNAATGVFTVPANEGGMYEVSVDAMFNGTAMSSTASFVTAKVNGTARKFFFALPFGTTKLQCQGTFNVYLSASDTLVLTGTITGTTPTFGDGAVVSSLSIKRIA